MYHVMKNTVFNLVVLMVDAADHVTGKTGLTLTISASKNGSTLSTITPNVTELTVGLYKLELTTSHTDTFGLLVLHVTGTGADPVDVMMQVVGFNPETQFAYETGGNVASIKTKTDNLPSSPAAVGSDMNLANGAITNAKLATGAIQGTHLADGILTSAKFGSGAINSTVAPNLDAAVSTRAPETGGNLAAVKSKTDNLPASPAAVGSQMALSDGAISAAKIDAGALTASKFGAGAIDSTVAPNLDTTISSRASESGGNLAAVKAKTDNLPASPAGIGDAMTLTGAYDAAKVASSQTSVDTMDTIVDLIHGTDLPDVKAVVDDIRDTDLPLVKSDTTGIKAKTDLIGGSVALETGGNVAAIKSKTDNLPALPAAQGDAMNLVSAYDAAKVAASASALAIVGGDVIIVKNTDLPAVKAVVDAIKAKTDNLPAQPAAVGSPMTLTAAYDAAKTAADQTSVDDLETLITFIKRVQTNKKRWDAANSRWQIYDDAGTSVLYNLKVYNPADGNVVLGSNAIAHGDKVA